MFYAICFQLFKISCSAHQYNLRALLRAGLAAACQLWCRIFLLLFRLVDFLMSNWFIFFWLLITVLNFQTHGDFSQISFVAAFVLFKLEHVGVEKYALTDPLLCGPAQRHVLEMFHVSLKRLYVLCRFLKFLKHVAWTFCIQWARHLFP